jgi:hypothetical protein
VIEEFLAVVGHDHNDGVVIEAFALQGFDELAKAVVTAGDAVVVELDHFAEAALDVGVDAVLVPGFEKSQDAGLGGAFAVGLAQSFRDVVGHVGVKSVDVKIKRLVPLALFEPGSDLGDQLRGGRELSHLVAFKAFGKAEILADEGVGEDAAGFVTGRFEELGQGFLLVSQDQLGGGGR